MFLESEIHGLSSIIFNYLISSNNTPQYPYSNYVKLCDRYDFQIFVGYGIHNHENGPLALTCWASAKFLAANVQGFVSICIIIYIYIFTCLAAASLHP